MEASTRRLRHACRMQAQASQLAAALEHAVLKYLCFQVNNKLGLADGVADGHDVGQAVLPLGLGVLDVVVIVKAALPPAAAGGPEGDGLGNRYLRVVHAQVLVDVRHDRPAEALAGERDVGIRKLLVHPLHRLHGAAHPLGEPLAAREHRHAGAEVVGSVSLKCARSAKCTCVVVKDPRA